MKTFLSAYWKNIIMINYEIDPQIIQSYLPAGVELDTYQDKCFISLVAFEFTQSKIGGIPIPYFGSFEEINLRFYVKRRNGLTQHRGVVFISELVPHATVAFLANALYKEHYAVGKINYTAEISALDKRLAYNWRVNQENMQISAVFQNTENPILPNTLEEFIYEHYYGYSRVSENETWEYRVNHPRWFVNPLLDFEITCDFEKLYGSDFSFLNYKKPFSVYNAIGSQVTIDWKIDKIKI